MKERIVGYVVGLSVGKFDLPDKGQANGISGLTPNCRVCRVFYSRRDCQRNQNAAFGKWDSHPIRIAVG
jgi:hypothetical protein